MRVAEGNKKLLHHTCACTCVTQKLKESRKDKAKFEEMIIFIAEGPYPPTMSALEAPR